MNKTRTKSTRIREVAQDLVARGMPPRPKDIMKILAEEGVRVLSNQVSTALRGTGLSIRKPDSEWKPAPTEVRGTPNGDIALAAEFVFKIGSLEAAVAAIGALAQTRIDREMHTR
jgi:hypothetical protein